MDYCGPLGIPRSVFLGRVVGPNDPMWLAEDSEWALEHSRLRSETCGGCGQSLHESMHPEFEGAYESALVVCHGCAEKEKADKGSSNKPPGARRVVTLPDEHRDRVLEVIAHQLLNPDEPGEVNE